MSLPRTVEWIKKRGSAPPNIFTITMMWLLRDFPKLWRRVLRSWNCRPAPMPLKITWHSPNLVALKVMTLISRHTKRNLMTVCVKWHAINPMTLGRWQSTNSQILVGNKENIRITCGVPLGNSKNRHSNWVQMNLACLKISIKHPKMSMWKRVDSQLYASTPGEAGYYFPIITWLNFVVRK